MKHLFLQITLLFIILAGSLNPWMSLADDASEQRMKHLLEQLTAREWEERESARLTVVKLGKAAIPYLSTIAMNHQEPPRLRNIAVGLLGDIGDEEAVPSLRTVLVDPHISLRWNATASLGKIGTPEAVAILIEQLRVKEEGSLEKYYAQEALLKVTNRAAFPTLVRALSDTTPLVVHTAQEVLTRLGGEEAVRPLAQTLQHTDPGIRRGAAEALKTIGHPQAVPFLKDTLRQETEGVVKVRIAEALASFSEESGRVALIPLIRHWDEGVKEAAIRAAGEYAVKEAVPVLAPLLKSPFPNWRARAAEALGKIGDTAVTKEIEEISQKDPSPEVREIAAKALDRLKVRQGR